MFIKTTETKWLKLRNVALATNYNKISWSTKTKTETII